MTLMLIQKWQDSFQNQFQLQLAIMASVVWDYFCKDDTKTFASCKKETCKQNIPIKAGNTTGLIHHLKSKHPEDFKQFEKEKRERNDDSDPLKRKQMKQPKFSFTSQSEAEKITQ